MSVVIRTVDELTTSAKDGMAAAESDILSFGSLRARKVDGGRCARVKFGSGRVFVFV